MSYQISVRKRYPVSTIVAVGDVAIWLLLTGAAASAQVSGSASTPSTTASALPTTTPDQVKVVLAQLSSPDKAQQEQAANQLRPMQQAIGRQVFEVAKKQVQEAKDAYAKLEASASKLTLEEQTKPHAAAQQKANTASRTIQLLGELHVEEAIPFLLENITFFAPEQSPRIDNWLGRYPCLGALVVLGLPATDATLHGIEEDVFPGMDPVQRKTDDMPYSAASYWGEMILARMLGPRGASGYIQDYIDRVKEQQKLLSFYPPPKDTSGKPAPTPVALRIERLEAVRARIEKNTKYWSGLVHVAKPNVP